MATVNAKSKQQEMGGCGDHAVVLGAGLAGLATAGALAQRFPRVTIVERDALPVAGRHRTGVPQGRHAHHLMPSGLTGLNELFPGIVDDLQAHGAHIIPVSEVPFYLGGGRLCLDEDGLRICGATRPLVEAVVRDRVHALPGVRFVERCDVAGVVTTQDRTRVTGVRLRSRTDPSGHEAMAADLVVDTTGRGSRSPRWLADLGYAVPVEDRMRVDVHYSTRLFHRDPEDLGGCRHVIVGIPPGGRRGGLTLAVEGDRWLVTLVGFLGERPPTDLDGFVAYARTLWSGELHELVSHATPIGEAATGVFHEYVRRRYDKLAQFPDRYVVSGDAVCSLSPVYAQGMSIAISEAQTLGRILDRHKLDRVGKRFFRKTRQIVDSAWTLATGADLAHPKAQGPRPASWRLINAYLNRLLPAAHRDPLVANTFLKVNTFVAPPLHLFKPRILARVLHQSRHPARTVPPEPDTGRVAPCNSEPAQEYVPRQRRGHGMADSEVRV